MPASSGSDTLGDLVPFNAGRRAGGALALQGKDMSGDRNGPDWWDRGLERVEGIEPSYAAWEAAVLPLNYTRAGHVGLYREMRLTTQMPGHRFKPDRRSSPRDLYGRIAARLKKRAKEAWAPMVFPGSTAGFARLANVHIVLSSRYAPGPWRR